MFEIQPGWTDARIADAMTEHAVSEFAADRSPDLNRYLAVLDPPGDYPKSIEAAMAIGVRGLMRLGASAEEAGMALADRFPDHIPVIDEAVAIESILVTNSRLRSLDAGPPRLDFPAELGPRLASGEARYLLVRKAGSGSFGMVAEGIDRALSSDDQPARVAIKLTRKVKHPQWGGAVEAIKARRIDHPQVVRVIDTGSDAALDVDYAVFNWIPGGTLEDRVQDHGCMSVKDAVAIISSSARAVHQIHRAGLIHRDLKPTNIMIGARGEPVITDVGIAVMNDGATFGDDGDAPFGCWAFMAPEQVDPTLPVSTATDVYALAAILVWLVTGKPLGGETVEEISSFHACRERGEPVVRLPIEIKGDLRRLIERALEHAPSRRHGSAQQFADDLDAWFQHRPIGWIRPSAPKRTGLLVRRNPIRAALLFFAVCAAGIGLWQWMEASIQRAERRAWNERKDEFVDRLLQMPEELRERGLTERIVALLWMLDQFRDTDLLNEVMNTGVSSEQLVKAARDARSAVPEGSFEHALWGVLETRWRTLDANDQPDGLVDLARSSEMGLRDVLDADDPLIFEAGVFLTCAELKALYWDAHRKGSDAGTAARIQTAQDIRADLLRFRDALQQRDPNGPMQVLVLRALRNVHHEFLIDDKDQWERFERERQAIESELATDDAGQA